MNKPENQTNNRFALHSFEPQIRWELVLAARERIASGAYDDPAILTAVALRVVDAVAR